MKKRLTALALSIASAVSVLTAIPVNAVYKPILGDISRDQQLNIADLVLMQKYLLGKYAPDAEQLFCLDMDSDGTVDIFDYLILKQQIESPEKRIVSKFTQCDTSFPHITAFDRSLNDRQAVIRNTEQLKAQFQPYDPDDPESSMNAKNTVYIASQATIDDLFERYDDDFFKNNVLLLNYLAGEIGYEYDSIVRDEDEIKIKFYDTTPAGLFWTQPLPPYIAEIAIPTDYFEGTNVVWERINKPLNETIKCETTNSITNDAVIFAASDKAPQMLTTAKQLEKFASKMFGTGVKNALLKAYDDEFFKRNTLILDINIPSYCDNFEVIPSVEINAYGTITLKYRKKYYGSDHKYKPMITQVTIPNDRVPSKEVVRKRTWEEYMSANYICLDFEAITHTEELSKYTFSDPAWIDSEEKLEEFLSENYTEKGAEIVRSYLDGVNFNSKAVYMWQDHDIVGTEFSLGSVHKCNNSIVLSSVRNFPLGDIAGEFLYMLVTDKKYSGMTVEDHVYNTDKLFPRTDGDVLIIEPPKDYLAFMINQYSFGGTNTADVYVLYPGGGPIRYGSYELMGSFELENGCMPFGKDSVLTYTENDDGSVICSSDDFIMTYSKNDRNIDISITYDEQKTVNINHEIKY